ncbi:unnamed protein product [Adineta ricciae]|uniref:GRAM domain-containing protein n=1 Tax=Adineta ricciae TaxID=249248 RepID=A0A814HWL2_ADIRI|nr:unnamed protein product [Adineta ricciae]CAF1017072.1 unnamed protein product [Adineta ricciae]
MATSRPSSLIIPSEVVDVTNSSTGLAKTSTAKPERSSSSSVDSSSAINNNTSDNISSSQNFVRTTTSSTTTESDLESEHGDQNRSREQKSDSNSQEQLSRRMKHFQKLFKSEIQGEMPELIDSYVCAYQGDILLQGKMYITDRYLCFHSRIISYVTKHVYRWEQIQRVTRERVAFIFPTAIGIQLKHSEKKIIYASFLQRDQAFDKIESIRLQATNDMSSYDDDDSDIMNDGTLKPTNHNRQGKSYKRDSYDIVDGPEENGVLGMCLKNTNKRPTSIISTKSSNDKQQSKTLINSYSKKSSDRSTLTNQTVSNDSNESNLYSNQTSRSSRYTKHEKKQPNNEKRNNSLVNHHQSTSNSVKYRQSQNQSQERASVSHNQPTHSPSAPPSELTRNLSVTDSNSRGLLTKFLNLFVSSMNILLQIIPSSIQHARTLPLKTTVCIVLFLILLFFHAFYLMKVANRIENRLHSLHNLWPSSSN